LANSLPFYIKLYNNLYCNNCETPPCFIEKENLCFNVTALFDAVSTNVVYGNVDFPILLSSTKKPNQNIAIVFAPATPEQIATRMRIVELSIKEEKDLWKLDKFLSTADYTDTFATVHNFDYNKKFYAKMFDVMSCGKTKEFFYIKKNGILDIGNFPASFLASVTGHLYKGLAVQGSIFQNIISMFKCGYRDTCFSYKEYVFSPQVTKPNNYCFVKSGMLVNSNKGQCRYFVARF